MALTTSELHCLMCPYYNVWPGVICCCLQLIMLFTNKFICESMVIIDIYIMTKFHKLFFLVFELQLYNSPIYLAHPYILSVLPYLVMCMFSVLMR